MSEYFDAAVPQDLNSYGLIPEFVGRFPLIVSTKALTREALVDVMTLPKNSLMKQYNYLFSLNGVGFHVTKEGLEAIADIAHSRGTGARGLRAITENLLMESFYVAPSSTTSGTVFVDSSAVRGVRPPILLRGGVEVEEFLKSYGEDDGVDSFELVEGKVELVGVNDEGGFEGLEEEVREGAEKAPEKVSASDDSAKANGRAKCCMGSSNSAGSLSLRLYRSSREDSVLISRRNVIKANGQCNCQGF